MTAPLPAEPVRVVLASHNPHKLVELRRVLGGALDGIELVSYDGPEPAETGTSFEENALIKARAAAAHTGLPAIADDSGICVDVMGGAPGIFSARWSGPAKDARENLELLLWQLSDVAPEHRGAHFTASAAYAMPDGRELAVLGEWPGSILEERRGEHGFGYDPIFRPEGEERSAAELSDAEKDASSHRRRAFDALMPKLREALGL
ncbi:dITP/XTP pyrophosphatase [Pseudoclavibacter triregionum]|nr:dITP/XTP pyrophosphatase [Pseudoclavibacter triregionum]